MRLVCLVIGICALIGPVAQASSPLAEVVCSSREVMQQRLEQSMQSTRQGIGTRGPEELVELWADSRGGWILVMTYATGASCIVAMGDDWMSFAETQAPDPA